MTRSSRSSSLGCRLDYSDIPTVILIATNVSEQMGGQAIKALQIALELSSRGIKVIQITHERVKVELSSACPELQVIYIPETRLFSLLWVIRVLRPLVQLMFQHNAAAAATKLLEQYPDAIVHYTSPVSPVLPAFTIPGSRTIFGPLNGSIFYPKGFRHRESWIDTIRRVSHGPLQLGHRLLFSGKQNADVLLVAGGERTYRSLRLAGCNDAQFVDSVDSGVLDRLYDLPRAQHIGRNLEFVHNGRLIDHKGTDLVIRALSHTRQPVRLTVIGRGPEKAKCERLVQTLGLGSRVTFIDWIEDHSQVATTLQQFRGFIFPSLAEANGIVVQEAMLLGVPVVALNWGGPALLVTRDTGILIEPTSEGQVVRELAAAMDLLALNDGLAERYSVAGRERAISQGYCWMDLIEQWIGVYRGLQPKQTEAAVAA